MRKISYLYSDIQSFKDFVTYKNLDRNYCYMVRIYTSNLDRDKSVELAKNIKQYLPNSCVSGASSGGLIYDGKIVEDSTMINIYIFDNPKFKLKVFSWDDKTPEELAKAVYDEYSDDPFNIIQTIFSDNYTHVNAFIESINEYKPVIKLVGGIACALDAVGGALTSENSDEKRGFVFTDQGCMKNSLLTIQPRGNLVNDNIHYNTPNDPISDVFKIDKVNDGIIETIEGVPSKKWFKSYFNVKDDMEKSIPFSEDKNFATYLIHFLFLPEGYGGAGRFLKYDEEHDALGMFFSTLPDNTKFRVGFFNPMKSREKLLEMFKEMQTMYIESITCYLCLFRKQFFMKMIETELSPLKNTGISGIFMYGEIAFMNGKNEMLNGSFVVHELAENKNKCEIDIDAFMRTAKIKLDSSVVDFVMKEKRNELQRQANFIGNEYYNDHVDGFTEFPNIIQFNMDNNLKHFNKLLMVYVENADMIIASEGYEAYIKTIVDSMQMIKNHISINYKADIFVYELSYCIFMAAERANYPNLNVNEQMKNLIDFYRVIQPDNTNIPVVLKFVMVSGEEENILQKGVNGLQETKILNLPYLIYDNYHNLTENEGKLESNIIATLKYAISNRTIVPYYQGIRNNHTGKITKYEALMRLVDKDGNVHLPAYFMDVAKKYHIYGKLSRIMIENVLEDFKDRDEEFSINISAYDIYSDEFCSWFWSAIKKFPNSSRVIIEIVESEELKDIERVRRFLNNAVYNKTSISVDDFGDGYSNLMQIIRLRPEYIKIDGSIVKDVCNSKANLIAMQTINFMAKNIGSEVIAEFVENEKIQKVLEKEGIKYSQGYYFAKPKPIEEL